MNSLRTAYLLFAAMTLQTQTSSVRMPEDVAVFAIHKADKGFSVEPVVLVHYGRDQHFKTIPALNSAVPEKSPTASDFDKFEKSFYRLGTLLSVFSGGEKIGTAKVLKSEIVGRDGGCIDLSASIGYVGNGNPLLASNTRSEIRGHEPTRRGTTEAETLTLRSLAIKWLVEYGIDRELLQRGNLQEAISTVLRENGGRALIGRFDVESKRAIHRLFAVAEQVKGQYELTLTDLETQQDVGNGDDKDKIELRYIDQLDIDNDGVDEIVTSSTYYERWSYEIWKFAAKQGIWYKAHEGPGGGC
jgi:hypothetical protein